MFEIERALTLTIAFHPDTSRIGEQAVLRQLTSGGTTELNRFAPTFAQHGEMPRPLEDTHISRSPITLTVDEESLVVDPGEAGVEVVLNGEWLRGPKSTPLWRVTRGLTMKLSDRVLLCVHLSEPGRGDTPARGLIGHGDAVDEIRELIGDLAADDDPALLIGEDGVGKALVAKAIHDASSRGGRTFIELDLGAIPPDEVHGVLFGDEGPIASAHEGTLYVEGLDEANQEVQKAIFALIRNHELTGEDGSVLSVDARVLVGSGRELEHAVADGHVLTEFTALFSMSLHIPALRYRREDIAPLFMHFLRQSLRERGGVTVLQDGGPGRPLWLPPDFMGRLLRHQWPGNGDQLAAVADEVATTCKEGYTIRITKAVERYLDDPEVADLGLGLGMPATGHVSADDIDDEDLVGALRAYRWSAVATATHLGTSVRTIHDLIDKSRMFKDASRVSDPAVRAACRQFRSELTLVAEQLQVSRRGLKRRLWSKGQG
jgi:two-component system, NtrC family, nitrogen regulation response regulator GlnG